MTITAFLIIIVVLGVIVSNIMLLKHSAKFSMKNVNQDPIKKAKAQLEAEKEKVEINKTGKQINEDNKTE